MPPRNGGEWDFDPTPCPSCGGRNVVGARSCWNCLSELNTATESAPAAEHAATSGAVPCLYCGEAQPPGSRWCSACGRRLGDRPKRPASGPATVTKEPTPAASPALAATGSLAISSPEKGAIVGILLLLVGSLLPWIQLPFPFGNITGGTIDEAKAVLLLAAAMAVALGISLRTRELRSYLLALEALCAALACFLSLRIWVRIGNAETSADGAAQMQQDLLQALGEGFHIAPDVGLYFVIAGAVIALVTCALRSKARRAWPVAIAVPCAVMIASTVLPRSGETSAIATSSPTVDATPSPGATAAPPSPAECDPPPDPPRPASRAVVALAIQSVEYIAESGDQLARVLVTVANKDTAPRYFDPGLGEAWTAVDEAGREYPSEVLLSGVEDELDGTEAVLPGNSLQGALYFRVPFGSRVARIRYQPDALNFSDAPPAPVETLAPR